MEPGKGEVCTDAESAVVDAFRREWGRVVVALIGFTATGTWPKFRAGRLHERGEGCGSSTAFPYHP